MTMERSTKVQIGAGAITVLVFVALVVVVGTRYSVPGAGAGSIDLDPTGGLALVGVLVFFVVLLTVVGLALSDQLSGD